MRFSNTALAYNVPFIFQNITKNYLPIITVTFLLLSLLTLSYHVSDNFSESLFEEKLEVIKDEIPEDTISVITVQKGDTLSSILKKENVPAADINKIITLTKKEKLAYNLKIGQEITFEYTIHIIEDQDLDLTNEERILNRISFAIDSVRSIDLIKENNNFVVHHISIPLKKLVTKYKTTISSSVISSLKSVGLSTNSILDLINAYSYQIDFQRDIKIGDKITVITEKFVTPDNKLSHHGSIIHASIKTNGRDYNIYKYSPDNSESTYEFFSEDGESIKSTLLKTPIKVAKISSHFGFRKKHPVLGYGAMHKGVDFAAPIGTPIYAAGNGVIEFAGWKSGYGRFIQVKHNGTTSTAYAHASKFAKNLKKGTRVNQGEIIAYVGDSGRVTGPHLHYEVKINGHHVNPAKFKSTPGIKLQGNQLKYFETYKVGVKKLSTKLNSAIELAAAEVKYIKLF